jgi:hypothetical protein
MNIFQELKLDLINWSKFCIRLISKKGISMFAFCVAIVTGFVYFYLWDSKAVLAICSIATIILLFKIGMFFQDLVCNCFKAIQSKIRQRKLRNSPYHITISDKPIKRKF